MADGNPTPPSFRPRHVGELLIEEPFVDCWADILISAGWMDRSDTTLRECNWAIVNLDRPLLNSLASEEADD